MAPLKLSEEQNATLTNKDTAEKADNQPLELHPEAYKVKGPSPDKMNTVSASLRTYAHGLYGLL
ncbi:MAG: hypothetical protein EOO20_13580 [Chryseobacterium sp.]|uniref:Uncharacterized protein n=1 Tax=Pedobacter agri TaxID=454586 RepID=A0A9X3IAY5_9SPHI|nr:MULTISPECIES: hypothetical protein [Pedobacter]AZI23982.1 hypothetical protein EA772_00960 [Pedobacter sp. G11]MCX3266068.1 hypothetical protein [Pedobacter agri]MDQ1139990.1 hypothetical protein [Pedobacter agri]RZJ88457.1 MAG: hypothetical protein EOO20_13580 [Chryseobacterium sp.]